MEIKQAVFYAEINWEAVLKATRKHKTVFAELPKYPAVRRDLTLRLDSNVSYEKIAAIAHKEAKKLLQTVNLFDVYENEAQLGANKKSYSISFVFQDPAAEVFSSLWEGAPGPDNQSSSGGRVVLFCAMHVIAHFMA